MIFSGNELKPELYVKKVLSRLRDAGLQVDITKSQFHVSEVAYLGLIVTTRGVRMDPAKVDTIVHWPALRNLKDIQSFLGFANFYRHFIYGFSRLAAPFTALTRKDVKFVWCKTVNLLLS